MNHTEKRELVEEVRNTDISGVLASIDDINTNDLCQAKIDCPPGSEITGTLNFPDEKLIVVKESLVFDSVRKEWAVAGQSLIAGGRCAVLILAGGQGTRLGWEGPKGTFPLGPVSGSSLFRIFAEKIIALAHRVKVSPSKIPLYIMTSTHNHKTTELFFERNNFFGLPKSNVKFFKQRGMIPATIETPRRLLLETRTEFLRVPEGNGGVFIAAAENGIFEDMAKKTIEYVHIIGVDNALQPILPAEMIGAASYADAEVATHWVHKTHSSEKVGTLVLKNDKPAVVEYTEVAAIATGKLEPGKFRFPLGSICSHLFKREFMEQVTLIQARLPYHAAIKTMDAFDYETFELKKTKALKLELFIFDVFPLAKKVVAYELNRTDCFSPLKNAEGNDSTPETARNAMSNLARKWILAAKGTSIEGAGYVEISPLKSLYGEHLENLGSLKAPIYIS